MRSFLKYLLASILGVIIASVLIFVLSLVIVSAIVSSQDKPEKVLDNSILQLKLNLPVHDRKSSLPVLVYNITSFRTDNQLGLNDILNNIAKAKKDNQIRGIFLDLSRIDAGIATVDEIRNALLDFKNSGKFIVAFSDSYSQKAYYLASIADKIYMNPGGSVDFIGLSAE